MRMFTKLMTALRGGANEAGEAIIDSQALRILDQEIRDASYALQESKNSLAEILAHQKVAEQKAKALQKEIDTHEGYAIKALEKNNESLALEIAEKIGDITAKLTQEKDSADNYSVSAGKLRTAIQQTEVNLKRMKQQVDTVKATDSVQRAQAAVAQRHSGSHSQMRSAMDSLERIKEKQTLKAAQIEAASELAEESSEAAFSAKLEQAGITNQKINAKDILNRLREKK